MSVDDHRRTIGRGVPHRRLAEEARPFRIDEELKTQDKNERGERETPLVAQHLFA